MRAIAGAILVLAGAVVIGAGIVAFSIDQHGAGPLGAVGLVPAVYGLAIVAKCIGPLRPQQDKGADEEP